MNNIRKEEIVFKNQINKIIEDNFALLPKDITKIELSTEKEDTKESFDIVYKSKVEISVRIRNNYALKYKDFTIRTRAMHGGKTEIDKIIKGKATIYLYAWKTKDDENFADWILIDVNKIRDKLQNSSRPIPNGDGTEFQRYSIQWLIDNKAIINSLFNCTKKENKKEKTDKNKIKSLF